MGSTYRSDLPPRCGSLESLLTRSDILCIDHYLAVSALLQQGEARRGEEEEGIRRRNEKEGVASRKRTMELLMRRHQRLDDLSLSNLGVNLSSTPFLDFDPASSSLDDPDLEVMTSRVVPLWRNLLHLQTISFVHCRTENPLMSSFFSPPP
ncbi:hypothetical protein GW17_00004102 [Ensete ventricosum]|nr:hypothetical protein GW17_00004102 [Ensete ventricosum]